MAVEPRLDSAAQVWRVKVVLTYPFIGSVGEVGEIAISAFSEEVFSHTHRLLKCERAPANFMSITVTGLEV